MISITCNHCQTVLEMDDAFAGGVCRCQHCGTIQTVPSHLKRAASPTSGEAAQPLPGSKTLYARANSDAGSGTGAENLGEVLAGNAVSTQPTGSAASTSDIALPAEP